MKEKSEHNCLTMKLSRLTAFLLCFLCLGRTLANSTTIKEGDNEYNEGKHTLTNQDLQNRMTRAPLMLNNENSHNDEQFRLFEFDKRFSYYLHIPEEFSDYSQEQKENVPFVVIVHGLHRNAKQLFDIAADKYPQWLILAPLFPDKIYTTSSCGDALDVLNGNDYRLLISNSSSRIQRNLSSYLTGEIIRFDYVLIGMICQAKREIGIDCRKKHSVSLVGYSAGAQFSHRFAYLHASMLKTLAIGAPGTVTLWNQNLPYWKGTGDIQAIFDKNHELDSLKNVNVLFYVGSEDTKALDVDTGVHLVDTYLIDNKRYNNVVTRIKLIKNLYDNWSSLGLGETRELKIIDGVAHDSTSTLKEALLFMEEIFHNNNRQKFKDFDE